MVGRSEQLAALRETFDRVGEGWPAVVLLGGGCVDLDGAGLAFAPFTAVLRGLVRQLGADGPASWCPRAPRE
jgi:hypothetical protein